jgi:hypothetical protein
MGWIWFVVDDRDAVRSNSHGNVLVVGNSDAIRRMDTVGFGRCLLISSIYEDTKSKPDSGEGRNKVFQAGLEMGNMVCWGKGQHAGGGGGDEERRGRREGGGRGRERQRERGTEWGGI